MPIEAIIIIFAILVLLILASCIRIVPQANAYIFGAFGRISGYLGCGITF